MCCVSHGRVVLCCDVMCAVLCCVVGVPLLINSLKALPKAVPFKLDTATEITVGFILLSLIVNLVIMACSKFIAPRSVP